MRAVIVVIGLMLGACADLLLRPASPLDAFVLAAPHTMGHLVQTSFVLQFSQGNQVVEFPMELEVTAERMAIVVFSPIGGALTTATLHNGIVDQTGGKALPAPLQGASLLRQVQLAIWPMSPLVPGLAAQGVEIVDAPDLRALKYQDKPLILIRGQWPDSLQGRVEFIHQSQHYRWSLTPVKLVPLDQPAS